MATAVRMLTKFRDWSETADTTVCTNMFMKMFPLDSMSNVKMRCLSMVFYIYIYIYNHKFFFCTRSLHVFRESIHNKSSLMYFVGKYEKIKTDMKGLR